MSHITVKWIDGHREPTQQPNPAYPNGIDVDLSGQATTACRADLPYPAKRCGHFLVVCQRCKFSTVITTAGRPDDPRSATLPCKLRPH